MTTRLTIRANLNADSFVVDTLPNGTAANPSLSFNADRASGLFLGTQGNVCATANGTHILSLTEDTVAVHGNMTATSFVGDGSGLTGVVLPLSITSVQITDASWVPIDDTALDTASGGNVVVRGTGFTNGSVVRIDGVNASSTVFVDTTTLRAVSGSKAAGTYDIQVVRPDGQSTTKAGGVTYSPFPTWNEATADLGTVVDFPANYAIANVAGDSNVVVSTTTLPPGLTANTDGTSVTISGTVSVYNDTVFGFDATVTDAENQDRTKSFTTWHASTYHSPFLGKGILNALQTSRDSTTVVGTGTVSTPGGTYPGNYAYAGGVLLPDGRVFCVPLTATSASIYDPVANSVSTVAGFPGSIDYIGGVLLPDGRVFCVPYNATSASIYDPVANTTTTVAGFPGSGAYIGGVLLPDGRVFCVPHNSTSASIYDPAANSVTTVAGFPGSTAYFGGVLLPDGRVFCVPHNATSASIYDPAANSVTTVAGFPGSAAYVGGVLLPDGRVFCVPHNATSASIYDPVTNTATTVAGFPGSADYIGGVLLPDGRVFCVPYNATSASIYDPVANTATTVAGFPGSDAYRGGVLLPDGRVFCVPASATTSRIFAPGSTIDTPITDSNTVLLSPFLNKF